MRPWEDAWRDALYGPGGFYHRPEGPAGHFRTAAHAAAPDLAAALLELARRLGCTALLDVGAGRGELLRACVPLAGDVRLHGVDVVARPPGLPPSVGWSAGLSALPAGAGENALVVAWELLDVVPCPVLVVGEDGVARVVHVDAFGRESDGAPAGAAEADWCARWWPLSEAGPGDRVEVGAPREAMWARLAGRVGADGGGALLAVDYAHTRASRPPLGSLAGFRAGRQVPPRPDGSTDVTAHVALDAVAEAGRAAGATDVWTGAQAKALADLGVSRAELLDPGSLGSFTWLLQRVPDARPADHAGSCADGLPHPGERSRAPARRPPGRLLGR